MKTKTIHKKNGVEEKAELASFNKPNETRKFPLGKLDLVKVGGAMIGRAIFEPGWKWSTSVKQIANTRKLRSTAFSISSFRYSENYHG